MLGSKYRYKIVQCSHIIANQWGSKVTYTLNTPHIPVKLYPISTLWSQMNPAVVPDNIASLEAMAFNHNLGYNKAAFTAFQFQEHIDLGNMELQGDVVLYDSYVDQSLGVKYFALVLERIIGT